MGGFTLTRLAIAIAETKYSVDEVIARAYQELASFAQHEPRTPDAIAVIDLFMHCFAMFNTSKAEDCEFVIVNHQGITYIDTVSYRNELMETGPFKGHTVCFPIPDSFSD